ncbi:MAG: hybrid sensor histidine kinase/response regulator [Cyanobacteria bacterium P01_D01_bin.1]
MKRNKEQQARATFLTESVKYFDEIESVLLALKTADDRISQLNAAMRAAHSIKGTAGMMDFAILSQIAHWLEDAFKILQARELEVDNHLSTLLLEGVDCLREVRNRHYRKEPVEPDWLAEQVEPVFTHLRQRLGELTPEDEARLLADEAGEDVEVILFTATVEEYLENFEQVLTELSGSMDKREQLRKTLLEIASQLTEVGLMAQLKPFVDLCRDVQRQCVSASAWSVEALAQQSLKAWQRSYSLVILGRKERLPARLEPIETILGRENSEQTVTESAARPKPKSGPSVKEYAPKAGSKQVASRASQQPSRKPQEEQTPATLQAQLNSRLGQALKRNNQNTVSGGAIAKNAFSGPTLPPNISEITPADIRHLQLQLSTLQTQLSAIQPYVESVAETAIVPAAPEAIEPFDHTATVSTPFDSAVFENLEVFDSINLSDIDDVIGEVSLQDRAGIGLGSATGAQTTGPATVQVPVEKLRQINRLFEALVLNRNAIGLRLEQLQAFSTLMQTRMTALSAFNTSLRQWYDHASISELASAESAPERAVGKALEEAALTPKPSTTANAADTLDVLELDSYSKLHLLAQENMETIVKLEEVSRDIDLGIGDMSQAIGDLSYTSRALKTQITQTQMRSFKEVVSRFPRVIRDWSVRYDKPVEIQIEGENTLLEQFTLDLLIDPLTHLLRNAFDHGIEDAQLRQSRKKPTVGMIELRALNRGNRVMVTLKDDGNGIDLAKVRDRIREYSLPDEQIESMTHQELLAFLFEPGFSTRSEVTHLSGRGVGMDVVRNNIQQLQGDIQVTTEAGKGTTFTLDIPLSLSILRVMLVERQGTVFALPIDAIQEMLNASPVLDTSDKTNDNHSLLLWQNKAIPVVQLEDYWQMNCAAKPAEMSGTPSIDRAMVVVVGEDSEESDSTTYRHYGLSIDRFWQEQEVAIRPVASPMPLPPGFSGTTVLGDGRVVPLVDPIRLMAWISEAGSAGIRPSAKSESGFSSLTPPTAATRAQAATPSIMIIDDSIHARQYLSISLEREGYLVEQAKDGREAVDRLLAGLNVTAIICDIEMPRLDGYGVLEELREHPEFHTLPIIMLTSRSGDRHRKIAMNLGATDYFSKPYNERVLLDQLRKLVQKIVTSQGQTIS